jgi:ubiquinone/menaquinone biosynthesis C-methylase UbiE
MDAVEHYYNSSADRERTRLDRHRTEFAVTLRALSEFLPSAPAAVLDVGGGPGRYAVALTERGYHVTLLDLAQQNLILAAEQARVSYVTLAGLMHGNTLDLSMFPAAQFDAVLLFGPLYHLFREGERHQAISEALRVLKPGGVLAAAFITRFAPFRTAARRDPLRLVQQRAQVERMVAVGTDEEGSDFPHVYFAHLLEVQPLLEQFGVQTLRIVGCEGVVAGMEERVNALEGEA